MTINNLQTNMADFDRFYKIGKALEPYAENISEELPPEEICAVVACNIEHDKDNNYITKNYNNWLHGDMLFKKKVDIDDSLIGKKIGEWKVLAYQIYGTSRGDAAYICRCSCGTVRSVRKSGLLNGTSNSCGCCRNRYRRNVADKPVICNMNTENGNASSQKKTGIEVLIEAGLLDENYLIKPNEIKIGGLVYRPVQ